MDNLHKFYTNIIQNNLYEWVAVWGMEYTQLFLHRENYEILLNHLGRKIKITEVPKKGNYSGEFVLISKGLNIIYDKDYYADDDGYNKKFINNLKKLFYSNVKHINEDFISIPPILDILGVNTNDKIIPCNFYRQGIQFDYMIEKILNVYSINVILEIGAGLGNMAHFVKKYNKNIKYIILDIPHTILIQYHFLKTLGYNVLLLQETQLNDINNIIKYESFDILFILPEHISKIDNNSIDLVINFDSIVELNPATVSFYIENINRITKYFYNVNKTYLQWPLLKLKLDKLCKCGRFRLLDYTPQVFTDNSQNSFSIGLSEGYINMIHVKD
jgi:SAM-dependent methyltransferase